MCYKDELQNRNSNKLQRKFEEDNVPVFIRNYFHNLNSEAGKLNYYSIIISMIKWMIENKKIKKQLVSEVIDSDINLLSKTDIMVYLETLINDGIAPSTINTKKNVLSSFWSHLVDEGICEKNIIRSIPKTKFKIKKKNNAKIPLSEDMMEMVEKIKQKKDYFVRERNLAIVRVLKGTGIRESELAGLDLQDLHLENDRPYITVMGKGVYYIQDADPVLVSRDAKLAFEKWLEIRNKIEDVIDDKAVFINKNGKRLNEYNIQAIFKKYSNQKITPHMMRHLYASILYQESGHDAAFVQEQLRHSDVNTTLGTYTAGDSRSYEILENM